MTRRVGSHPRWPGARQAVDDPLAIWQLFHEPMYRWGDVPGSEVLCEQLMLNPQDPYLQDVFEQVRQDQLAQAVVSGNPFHGNAPPVGVLPPLMPGKIPVATLPTGNVLSIDAIALTKNLCVVGPSGSGKTNWLRVLIAAALRCV